MTHSEPNKRVKTSGWDVLLCKRCGGKRTDGKCLNNHPIRIPPLIGCVAERDTTPRSER